MSYKYRSRLEKTESKKFARQAMVLGVITLVLVIILIVIGIPALTKLAVFFSSKPDLGGSESQDTLAPVSPQLNTPPEATNSAELSFSGYAESGTEVLLKRDDVVVQKSLVDASGSFSFPSIQLQKGSNEFRLTSIDQSGNESAPSPLVRINYDNEKPKLSLSSPKEGAQFFGASERLIAITGETDQDTHVVLNNRSLVVGSDGSFTTSYELQEGENQLQIIATDKAGNITSTTIKVAYQP